MKRQQKPMGTETRISITVVTFPCILFYFFFMRKEKIPILPFEQIVLHDLSSVYEAENLDLF